mmetsp:Transcript_68346/g.189127  ORF Transcript_68346/g.189127 Transcript_68346/m.189127 type:complete len:100 (-) Transcript_68346:82-381(-)
MGPVGLLRKVYSWPAGAVRSDQLRATRYMLNNTEEVTLDYGAHLVLNLAEVKQHSVVEVRDGVLRNKVTGLVQCFIHGNGSGKRMWRDLLLLLHGLHSR